MGFAYWASWKSYLYKEACCFIVCQLKGIECGIEQGNMELSFIETIWPGCNFKMRPVWYILYGQGV